MTSYEQKKQTRIQTEEQLLNGNLSFTGTFLAVQYIEECIGNDTRQASEQTVDILLESLDSAKFENKKQNYFLYQQISRLLIHIIVQVSFLPVYSIIVSLQHLLLSSRGNKKRAVSEALGSLPINICGPKLDHQLYQDSLPLSFESFINNQNVIASNPLIWKGRTLIMDLSSKEYLCIKFARTKDDLSSLCKEIRWLIFLNHNSIEATAFNPPKPVCINNNFLFEFNELPTSIDKNKEITKPYHGIAFITEQNYFDYPNGSTQIIKNENLVQKTFQKCAKILGAMVSKGIIHTALIPLFHNRVQQTRRQDQGLYNWQQGGRLDQWLNSCKYPNFAVSGLRDFEHLISVDNSDCLHHYIGEHILGFILVLASCFRNQAPDMLGLDKNGVPIDVRHLFKKPLFRDLICIIINTYYSEITGRSFQQINDFINPDFIDQLINAMGIDIHMEERVRIEDQNNMTETEFKLFFINRGIDRRKIEKMDKGIEDIIIHTGPHLGGFNQPISVPKLIDLLFCLSSMCISDRYIMENRLKAS